LDNTLCYMGSVHLQGIQLQLAMVGLWNFNNEKKADYMHKYNKVIYLNDNAMMMNDNEMEGQTREYFQSSGRGLGWEAYKIF